MCTSVNNKKYHHSRLNGVANWDGSRKQRSDSASKLRYESTYISLPVWRDSRPTNTANNTNEYYSSWTKDVREQIRLTIHSFLTHENFFLCLYFSGDNNCVGSRLNWPQLPVQSTFFLLSTPNLIFPVLEGRNLRDYKQITQSARQTLAYQMVCRAEQIIPCQILSFVVTAINDEAYWQLCDAQYSPRLQPTTCIDSTTFPKTIVSESKQEKFAQLPYTGQGKGKVVPIHAVKT